MVRTGLVPHENAQGSAIGLQMHIYVVLLVMHIEVCLCFTAGDVGMDKY